MKFATALVLSLSIVFTGCGREDKNRGAESFRVPQKKQANAEIVEIQNISQLLVDYKNQTISTAIFKQLLIENVESILMREDLSEYHLRSNRLERLFNLLESVDDQIDLDLALEFEGAFSGSSPSNLWLATSFYLKNRMNEAQGERYLKRLEKMDVNINSIWAISPLAQDGILETKLPESFVKYMRQIKSIHRDSPDSLKVFFLRTRTSGTIDGGALKLQNFWLGNILESNSLHSGNQRIIELIEELSAELSFLDPETLFEEYFQFTANKMSIYWNWLRDKNAVEQFSYNPDSEDLFSFYQRLKYQHIENTPRNCEAIELNDEGDAGALENFRALSLRYQIYRSLLSVDSTENKSYCYSESVKILQKILSLYSEHTYYEGKTKTSYYHDPGILEGENITMTPGILKLQNSKLIVAETMSFHPFSMIVAHGQNISLKVGQMINPWIDVSGGATTPGTPFVDPMWEKSVQHTRKLSGFHPNFAGMNFCTSSGTEYLIKVGSPARRQSSGASGVASGHITLVGVNSLIGNSLFNLQGGSGGRGAKGFDSPYCAGGVFSDPKLREGRDHRVRGKVKNCRSVKVIGEWETKCTESSKSAVKSSSYISSRAGKVLRGQGGHGGVPGKGGVMEIKRSAKTLFSGVYINISRGEGGTPGSAGDCGPSAPSNSRGGFKGDDARVISAEELEMLSGRIIRGLTL